MNLHSGGKYHLKSIKAKSSRLCSCQLPNVSLCAQNQLTHRRYRYELQQCCASLSVGIVGFKLRIKPYC